MHVIYTLEITLSLSLSQDHFQRFIPSVGGHYGTDAHSYSHGGGRMVSGVTVGPYGTAKLQFPPAPPPKPGSKGGAGDSGAGGTGAGHTEGSAGGTGGGADGGGSDSTGGKGKYLHVYCIPIKDSLKKNVKKDLLCNPQRLTVVFPLVEQETI